MKRITIIGGHYGSGKSEISVHLSLKHHVDYLVDLDIINPYFRSRALSEMLNQEGINMVESTIKNKLNSDMPYVSGEGKIPFINENVTAIYDLGGTENGVRVLIQFLDHVKNLDDIDFLITCNTFRPETATAKKIIDTIKMYEAEAQLKVTGLINNTNLMNETTLDDIKEGENVISEVSKQLNLPIKYTVVEESLDIEYQFKGEEIRLERLVAKKWL
jgi:hypothetical protein